MQARVNFRYFYFGLSVLALASLGWLRNLTGETNLPPLEPMMRLALHTLFLNLLLSFYLLAEKTGNEPVPPAVWPAAVLIAVPFFFMGPVFSGDIYEYLIRGRILALYGQSPYSHFPGEFKQDILTPFSIWQNTPDAYGPVFLYIKALPAIFFRDSVVGMVAGMKAINFIFAAAAVWAFAGLSKLLSDEPSKLLKLFAFSPLLIVATLVDGLNDVVMTAFILGSVYFILKGRGTAGACLWALAFLVKYTAVLSLPFLAMAAMKAQIEKTGRFSWKNFFVQVFCAVFLIALAYAPVWAGLETFGMISNLGQRFYTNTIPYAFQEVLGLAGIHVSDAVTRTAFLGFFLGVYASLLFLFWRKKEGWRRYLIWSLALMHLCFYFSLSTPFIYNYLVWGLPWVVLCAWPRSALLVTLYSFAGIFSYFKRINYLMLLAVAIYFCVVIWQYSRGCKERTAH